MSKHRVIYVPGIGDNQFRAQSLLVKLWCLRGLKGYCHPMPWRGSEEFAPKLQRLLDRIDTLAAQNHTVSLVGASAGASAVMHALLARKSAVHRVVLICAKINHPETVSPHLYAKNPAFRSSLESLQPLLATLTATETARLLSLYSAADRTVSIADHELPGVRQEKLPPRNHGMAIFYCLTWGAGRIASFVRAA